MTALTDNPRITLAFCVPCNRRDAVHVGGRCLMADTHSQLHPCRGCGRPLAGPDRWCSDACFRAEDGLPVEDDEL